MEALVGAVAMRHAGRSTPFAITIWGLTALVLTAAVVAGYSALSGVDESSFAFPLGLRRRRGARKPRDTLMPEAFERGRPLNSFTAALGFFVSFVLAG